MTTILILSQILLYILPMSELTKFWGIQKARNPMMFSFNAQLPKYRTEQYIH